MPRYPVAASAGFLGCRLYDCGDFGGAKQIVRERGRLRRQDLEGSPLMCRGRSSQAASYGDQGQEQGRGGHKVKTPVPISGPMMEPSPLTRMSRPLTATTRSAGI